MAKTQAMANEGVAGTCWRYCHGLRIDGRPSYARGSRIRPLPGTEAWENVPAHESLAVCLRQAVALSGGRLQRCPVPWMLDRQESVAWAQHCLPHHHVWRAENWSSAVVLDMATAAIHAGGIALLHWRPDNQVSRWVLVTGVEQAWSHNGWGTARSLLVLDQRSPLAWSCAHNLLLVPATDLEEQTQTQANHTAWYIRTLDGGCFCGIGHEVLLCHPRPGQSDASDI